jgi:hypothetical protein
VQGHEQGHPWQLIDGLRLGLAASEARHAHNRDGRIANRGDGSNINAGGEQSRELHISADSLAGEGGPRFYS